MSFIVKGTLCGQLCGDCREPLTNATVLIYSAEKSDLVLDHVTANPKHTIHLRDDKSLKPLNKRLIGQAKCDKDGAYKVQLDKSCKGGSIDVDVRISQVPGAKKKVKKTVQYHLTTLQPQWREDGNNLFFAWDYCLSLSLWCAIRALFDAWVICGHVRLCEANDQRPVVGATVSAYDADWLTDDLLDTAVTDSNGHFRIDYTSADFKQTFLSPLINVETPFSPQLGPDVYFKAELPGGLVVVDETRPDGQAPGRRDIPNCFCVDLCADSGGGIDEPPLGSVWTGIGTEATIPTPGFLNDFDDAGYYGAEKYAFQGNIRATGQVAISSTNQALRGNPYEYRFLVCDDQPLIPGNTAAALDASAFNKTIGVDANTFHSIQVGYMWHVPSGRVVEIKAVLDADPSKSDLDADGWLDVNKSVRRVFTDTVDLDPADLTNPVTADDWMWVDTDGMMGIRTAAFTTGTTPTVAEPGNEVPNSQNIPLEKIAIRFELREVINKSANAFNYLPGHGKTLNAMVVNNNLATAEIALKQHLETTDCSPLSGDIDVAFTAYHPFLKDVKIHLNSNDGSVDTDLTGAGLSLENNTDNAQDQRFSGALSIKGSPNNVPLHTCTYILDLKINRRLHNGDEYTGHQNVAPRSFFYST